VGLGFDQEPEPELLDSGPAGREASPGGRTTWRQRPQTWLRACGVWLSGRGVAAPTSGADGPWADGVRSGRGRQRALLGRVPGWVVVSVAAALLVGGGLGLSGGHARRGVPSVVPDLQAVTVPAACRGFVITASSAFPSGDRVEFGDIGLPPAFQATLPPAMERTGWPGWEYAVRTGFVTPGNAPSVTIEVPARWRATVALRNPNGMSSTLTLPSCPSQQTWNTYVSVFYLHSPTACVPLQVRVGRHVGTAWFGVGRHCPHP
jgi:hypothetical protein